MNFDFSSFDDCKKLIRLSPYLVSTYMGNADDLHLEEEKVIELAHFEDFSLTAEENSASSDIFLDLESESFHEIWELKNSEIYNLLQNIPRASNIVLGTQSDILADMLERLAIQVAQADGFIHDLEMSAAHDLDLIFEDLRMLTEEAEKIMSTDINHRSFPTSHESEIKLAMEDGEELTQEDIEENS